MSNEYTLTLAFLKSGREEAAKELERLAPEDVAAFFENVPAKLASGVLEAMMPWQVSRCFLHMDPETAAGIIAAINAPLSTILLRLLPQDFIDRIFAKLPKSKGRFFSRLLAYPEEMIGAWMDPLVAAVPDTSNVEESLKYASRFGDSLGNYLYVTKREGTYTGIVLLTDLFLAKKRVPVADLIVHDFEPILDRATLESARFISEWSQFKKLPVVNRKNHLMGELSFASLCKGLSMHPEEHTADNIGSLIAQFGEVYFSSLAEMVNFLTESNVFMDDNSGRRKDRNG